MGEKVLGVILDLSLRHEKDGRRIIDVVKRDLVNYVKNALEDGDDMFYLYHPKLDEVVYNIGDAISAIGNYETDGWQFNVNYAFKQTLYVLEAQDPSYKRIIFFITDRLTDMKVLEKAFFINDKDIINCELIVIAIGDHCNCKEIEEIVSINEGKLIRIKEAKGLADQLSQIWEDENAEN
jgi:hypothetical protein